LNTSRVPSGVHAIEPALLDYVTEYVADYDLATQLGDEFDRESSLIVFCRSLFEQLFDNVIGQPVNGFGPQAAERASVIRRLHGREWSRDLKKLVGHFQHFCRLHSDLLSEAYSGGRETKAELLFELVPVLLSDLQAWAGDRPDRELADAVGNASREYDAYVSAWTPDWEVDD
jgi:hypothetical protein